MDSTRFIARIIESVPEVREHLTPKALEVFNYKTFDYFLRALNSNLLELSRGEISESQFVDDLAALLDQQLKRAWNEGMRANGLDPLLDMTPEWEQALQDIIATQYGYVDQFAADIASGKYTLSQLQARAAMWANRYTDTVNQAKLITSDGKDRLEWVLGEAEHCDTCLALSGIVAFAKEWDTIGIRPQSERLACHGYNCKCELIPTTKRRTNDAYGQIEEALLA